jgi:hypothetical protein
MQRSRLFPLCGSGIFTMWFWSLPCSSSSRGGAEGRIVSWRFLQGWTGGSVYSLRKLCIELLYDVTVLLLGIYPKEVKLIYQRDACIPVFVTALFTIAVI